VGGGWPRSQAGFYQVEGATGPSPLGTGDGSVTLPKPPPIRVFSLCMKGARIRYQQTGEFHFLTFSCFRRRPYLSPDAAKDLFEDALERVRRRYLFVVGGYVVMPEHVHLLVNEPQRGLLSRAVQAFKLSVSMRSRQRPFWQAHYYDFNISTHEKFVEKLRYIHRNPVRRGLVAKPEDWKWSSFLHYQRGMRGIVEIESEWTARERGWQLPEWMRDLQSSASTSPVPESEGPGAPSAE
jgi:putative transposase